MKRILILTSLVLVGCTGSPDPTNCTVAYDPQTGQNYEKCVYPIDLGGVDLKCPPDADYFACTL